MRSFFNEKCLLRPILLWSLAISAAAAIIVALAVRHHRYLIEKKLNEKDADIKECGC